MWAVCHTDCFPCCHAQPRSLNFSELQFFMYNSVSLLAFSEIMHTMSCVAHEILSKRSRYIIIVFVIIRNSIILT